MANEKRLIDANAVKERIWYGNSDPSGLRQYASGFIDNAPTVDAVEVVRCKDCKHCRNSVYPFIDHTLRECKVWKSATREDDFCSYGERRNDV